MERRLRLRILSRQAIVNKTVFHPAVPYHRGSGWVTLRITTLSGDEVSTTVSRDADRRATRYRACVKTQNHHKPEKNLTTKKTQSHKG